MSIPGLDNWLQTPQGRYVLHWEQDRVDRAVDDIFGYHAVQVGLPQVDLLRASRIPLRILAGDIHPGPAPTGELLRVRCDPGQLPFAQASVDLLVLPHVLEFHPDPHQVLREVERVLIPEGQVIITGFNPLSLWGARRRLTWGPGQFPWDGRYLSVLRLKDWLALLGFEMDRGCFGCYAPPFRQEKWFRRCRFMELAGDRWWGFAGGTYMIRAVKRVPGMRLIQPNWRRDRSKPKALAQIIPQRRGAGPSQGT